MHATADTHPFMLRERLGAARDARRSTASLFAELKNSKDTLMLNET
jgi:hypothetical protein